MKKAQKSLFLLIFCFSASTLAGYGYGTEDPLILGFKSLASKLGKQDWAGIEKEITKLEGQIINAEHFSSLPFSSEFAKSVQKQDRQLLAQTWTQLTVVTCQLQLWWNLHEALADRNRCKARVNAIDRYMKDILGPPIKQHDHQHNSKIHPRLITLIGEMRSALGNPGAFGLGKVPAKPESFLEHALQFQQLIRQVFPSNQKRETLSLEALTSNSNFQTQRLALEQAGYDLIKQGHKNWQSTMIALFTLMAQPGHGQDPEKPAQPLFFKTLKTFIKNYKT